MSTIEITEECLHLAGIKPLRVKDGWGDYIGEAYTRGYHYSDPAEQEYQNQLDRQHSMGTWKMFKELQKKAEGEIHKMQRDVARALKSFGLKMPKWDLQWDTSIGPDTAGYLDIVVPGTSKWLDTLDEDTFDKLDVTLRKVFNRLFRKARMPAEYDTTDDGHTGDLTMHVAFLEPEGDY